MYRLFFSLIINIIMFYSLLWCSGKKPKSYPSDKFKNALETIQIGDQKIILETYLWRDFMPKSKPAGSDLKIVVNVISKSDISLLRSLDVDSVWVINQNEIWGDNLEDSGIQDTSHLDMKIQKTASGGPLWKPGIKVTVVVKIIDVNQKTYLLKADNQIIHQTF